MSGKKMMILWVLVFCTSMVFTHSGSAFAYDNYHNVIRVHLTTTANGVKVQAVYSNYQVLNSSGAVVAAANAGSTVTLTEGQTLSSVNGYGRFSYNGKEYRGDLIYRGGYLVNRLGMEEYLYSVVQMEIGGYAPALESLKAQAVASRSYAAVKKKSPRTAYYDVVATTSDQAYGGYSAEGYSTNTASVSYRIREACTATKDQVLYYNGTLVNAIYCANTGGYSASAATVWGGNYPYLQGIVVPWDSKPFVADNFSTTSNASYQAVKMPTSYQWVKTWSAGEVVSKIESGSKKNLGSLQDITVDYDTGGYCKAVTFHGSSGKVTLSGENVRSYLSLRSSRFSVILGESFAAKKTFSAQFIPLASFTQFFNRSAQTITFRGSGYGHGVGMSQWAACVMAYEGLDYRYILNYFYNGNREDGLLTLTTFKG